MQVFFFFSSRRRHTRLQGNWSSDVCSSDLEGPGANGNIRAYLLDQQASADAPLPASRSFEIRGGANQSLPWNLRARGNVNYFSSLQTNQTFNTNVLDASQGQRSFGGNVVGAWR